MTPRHYHPPFGGGWYYPQQKRKERIINYYITLKEFLETKPVELADHFDLKEGDTITIKTERSA